MAKWTDENIRELFDRLLVCATELEVLRVYCTVETEFGITHAGAESEPGVVSKRMAWGVLTNYRQYDAGCDESRAGAPVPHGEVHLIRVFCRPLNNRSLRTRTTFPNEARLAGLLRRPLAETQQLVREHGPLQGREGFGLV